jgi:hypothetical protein
MKKRTTGILCLFLSILTLTAIAQNDRVAAGKPFLIKLPASFSAVTGDPGTLGKWMQGTGYELRPQTALSLAQTGTTYKQYYKSIEVEHARLVVQSDNQHGTILSGELYEIPKAISSTPTVDEAAALQHALAFVNASLYK